MKIGKDIQRSSKDCQRSLYKKRYIIHYNPSSNQPQDLSSIEILHSSDHPSMDPPMAIRILAHYFNKGCFLKSWGNTPQIIYFRIFMDCRWNQPYQPSSYIGVPPFMEPPYQHIPTNHLKVFSFFSIGSGYLWDPQIWDSQVARDRLILHLTCGGTG